MIKRAQYMSKSGMRGKTLYDLYGEIRSDATLSPLQEQRVVRQIEGITSGAPPDTPLGVLMARGLGGGVGYLISKYFGMGPVGRAVASVTGFGLGKTVHDQFNKPPKTNSGWRFI